MESTSPTVRNGLCESLGVRRAVCWNKFMRLLTSVLPRDRLLLTGGWFTLALCGFFFGLEVLGRHATTDFHDGLAGFVLLGAVVAVTARHRRRLSGGFAPGSWSRKLVGSLATLRYDHGIDLRGTPPIPRAHRPRCG